MLARALTLVAVFFCAGAIVQVATRRDPSQPRSPLTELPRAIESWRGIDAAPLADDVVAQSALRTRRSPDFGLYRLLRQST
jgi:hypothetical protein